MLKMNPEEREKHFAAKSYLNTVGPGQYELPATLAANQVVSTKKTEPKFSMGSR